MTGISVNDAIFDVVIRLVSAGLIMLVFVIATVAAFLIVGHAFEVARVMWQRRVGPVSAWQIFKEEEYCMASDVDVDDYSNELPARANRRNASTKHAADSQCEVLT